MKYKTVCDWCGKPIERQTLKRHNFCCRQCLADFSNKKKNPERYKELRDLTNAGAALSKLNRKLNPTRMTPEIRERLRQARLGSGESKTYSKYYGRHEHRVVAEQILGRSLLPGEVVHHIDGNKRNNSPDNPMIFPSQAEHARFHQRLKDKEVTPNEVHTA